MKRILTLFYFVIFALSIQAQIPEKQKITVADLYRTYTYYPQSVYGLVSMNDGLHYSALEGDSVIAKYSYKTGKKVENIVSVSDFNNDKIKEFIIILLIVMKVK